MNRLDGKVAFLSGAARGIGAETAKLMASVGAKVALGDMLDERGRQTAKEIEAAGGQALYVSLDVTQEASWAAAMDATVKKFGELDILVNNAGIGYLFGPLLEMTQEHWDAVLGVNLRGCFFGIKHAGKQMVKQGQGGRIINIASQAAKSAFANTGAYTSSKHGLVGLTRVAALELGPHNITVNAICPNHVTTGLGAWQNDFMSKAQGKTMDEYMGAMRARIPLGRPGLPDDIAKACAFLCSDEAAYITAECMNVSGGEEYH